ncbi:MAG: RsmD family RNA methyltransferase [Planctomycetota bacterium]
MLRIIAGEFRSRRLIEPKGAESSRPYPDRVKESVFNQLREWFEGAHVVDLFAGVGTVGLEAISRGAAAVLMVESDRETHDRLVKNVAALGCGDRATAMLADALGPACVRRAPRPVDLLFVDPPYRMMRDAPSRARVMSQIAHFREVLRERSFVILRSPLDPGRVDMTMEGFAGPEAHRHGSDMWILYYEPMGRFCDDSSPAPPGA